MPINMISAQSITNTSLYPYNQTNPKLINNITGQFDRIISMNMDKLDYALKDLPVVKIAGPPLSTLNFTITNSSGKIVLADKILTDSSGYATYSFNLTSFTRGIYLATINKGDIKSMEEFGVNLSLDCTPTSILTTKDSYYLGDAILIFGKAAPDCLLQVSLSDPDDKLTKSQQVMTGEMGIFSVFDFKIPKEGPTGIWSLEAASESFHLSTKFNVLPPTSSHINNS